MHILYMGNSQSIQNSIVRQNALIQEIHTEALSLSDQYNIQFLDPSFCNRIALIYNDKLQNYRKQELDGVNYTLGLVTDLPSTKSKVCETIVKHYTDRLNLLAGIQYSLNYVSDRIFALTTGPRCDGNPEVFDQNKCLKSSGQWQNYVVMPDATINENQTWYKYVNELQLNYLNSLTKLLDIVQQLKNFDEDITDERLKTLNQETQQIIDSMHQNAYELYKLALVTPTFTPEEIKLYKEQELIKKQENAARLEALRTARGLPPT